MKPLDSDIDLRIAVESTGIAIKNVIKLLSDSQENYLYQDRVDSWHFDALIAIVCHELERLQKDCESISDKMMKKEGRK